MNNEEDYMKLVKEQIELDKLLHSVKPEKKELAKKLLDKKKEVIKKNGIFADLELRKLNKKIEKLKKTNK